MQFNAIQLEIPRIILASVLETGPHPVLSDVMCIFDANNMLIQAHGAYHVCNV